MTSHRKKLALAMLALFVLILVPFVLWEDPMNAWAGAMLHAQRSKAWSAGVIVLLLVADIVLPIPSSIVSTSSGYLLGFALGAAAGWLGMTVACLGGYALGRFAGNGLLRRLLSAEEMERAQEDFARSGDWVLAVSRPVPMLAEASVMMAGTLGRPFGRFALVTGLANAGISMVYAAAGAFASGLDSFLLAFVAAMLLPWVYGRLRPGRHSASE
ncbi:MAG: VTT domain-containing protein [Bryobacterales bacterium]|nr:VTT domain-containing protein [Bryobacterales bacterium]